MKNITKKYTILAVDDESSNLGILERFLKSKYDLILVNSGEEVLKILDSGQHIDLMLLDITMPRMDGFTLAGKIKEIESARDIPFIFLTGQMDPEHIYKGFELGGQDYITKPYHALELRARVATHLKLKSQQQELTDMNLHLEKMVEERTQALQNLLEEKEALILELTHRVKNMLQMSISLMQIRLQNISHAESRQAIHDFLSSIQIISLAHNLTRSEKDLLKIPTEMFFSQFITLIQQRFSGEERQIECRLKCQKLYLHFNTVIPLGLLAANIISVVIEYCPKTVKKAEFDIRFMSADGPKYALEIEFKKINIPDPDSEELKNKLMIAYLFAKQLKSKLILDDSKTRFQLEFSEPSLRTYNPYIEKTDAPARRSRSK